MTRIDLLLHGIPGRSNQGYLGQSSSALVDGTAVIDTGSIARRPLLESSLSNAGIDPRDVEDVLLTHMHFDHCGNVDLFGEATVHVYGPELDRIRHGDTDWATPAWADDVLADLDVETFEAGETVCGLEVMATPGHVEHHVSFLLDGDLVYGFTGDGVKNTREFATRDPMVIYDREAAIETLDRVAEAVDFVIPGHDMPFYVEDGEPVPAADVEFGVNLQFSPDSATTVRAESSRSTVRDPPEAVRDLAGRQEFH